MNGLVEAAKRLASIECGPGYANAVMDAYGQLPEGQLYDDLGTVLAALSHLTVEGLAGALKRMEWLPEGEGSQIDRDLFWTGMAEVAISYITGPEGNGTADRCSPDLVCGDAKSAATEEVKP